MSYIVSWSSTGSPNGKPVITVADRTFDDTSTSLTLTGKGLKDYGLFQQENFLRLLENFSSTLAPANPTSGQIWYKSNEECLKVYNGSEWKNVCADAAFGIGDYDGYNENGDFDGTGFAYRLNRIIGSPVGTVTGESFNNVFGWGQVDYVPTYNVDSTLSATAAAWEPALPNGLTFPQAFNNNAWAIALSRLRKALRQVGGNEAITSPVGFVNDGLPNGTGNTLANLYNDFGGFGTRPNILAGYGGAGNSALSTYYANSLVALDYVEDNRFNLDAAQKEVAAVSSVTRTTPAKSLTIPTPAGTYMHTVQMAFGSEDEARAFFNAGGSVSFELDFTPHSGSPTNVERDWETFLSAFSGMCFDYKGIKLDPTYHSITDYSDYLPVIDGGSVYRGFYDLTSTPQQIFVRDVLDTPGNLFVYTTPVNGGIIITASATTVGSNFVVTFNIDYQLKHVTGGSPAQKDGSDVELSGTLSSEINLHYASPDNCNYPGILLPTVTNSGTFVTAP